VQHCILQLTAQLVTSHIRQHDATNMKAAPRIRQRMRIRTRHTARLQPMAGRLITGGSINQRPFDTRITRIDY
jgi:hypothetical protein